MELPLRDDEMVRFMQGFLRSRVWPIVSIVLLFCCAMAVAGGLLWTAKIREDVEVIGIIKYQLPMGAAFFDVDHDEREIEIIGKSAAPELEAIEPGQTVHIMVAAANGAEASVDAQFLDLSTEGGGRSLRLRLMPGEGGGLPGTLAAMDANAARIHITFRGKRLLIAAFEKTAL